MIEFRLAVHWLLPERQVVEVWHDGVFVATITAADGDAAGLRVLTKHRLTARLPEDQQGPWAASLGGVALAVDGFPANTLEIAIGKQ